MPLSHADGVHSMIDWIGPMISRNGTKDERDAANRKLADECLARMQREQFSESMMREAVFHLREFSQTIVTRIQTQCPAVFATGEDVNLYHPYPASVTE